MDASELVIYFLVAINGVLVGVVAFFLKSLLLKFTNVEHSINELNKSITVLFERQDHHKERFGEFSVFERRVDQEIKDMRVRMHDIEGAFSKFNMRCELTHNTDK